MARVRRPKAESIEKITALRALGLSTAQIAERMCISRSHVKHLITKFAIGKSTPCPHCGLDTAHAKHES